MIGERIKRARTAKGISLEKLANQIGGITKQAINKYELSKATPSSDILIRLSKVLDVKTEYFFRPIDVKLEKVNFRCKSTLPIKEQKKIEESARDHLERYLLLEEMVNVKEKPLNSVKIDFSIYQSENAEEAALELRKKWEIGFDPIENITDLLEEKDIKVVEVEASDKFDGLSGYFDDKYAFIVIGKNWSGERQRFTLAHEIGHLVLNLSPDCKPKNREKCCHRFAGAFLVPQSIVYLELGEHRSNILDEELKILKKKYGLSMAAWIYRAYDLGIISHSYFTNMYKYFGKQGWRKKDGEPNKLPPEKPTRFLKILLYALSENIISDSKASDILGVESANLRQEIDQWIKKLIA